MSQQPNHLSLQAALDQFRAMLRDIVPILWVHYARLKEAGFTSEEAFTLTRDVQRKILHPGEVDPE